MDSPRDMQAEKERIFLINFFIFFFLLETKQFQ